MSEAWNKAKKFVDSLSDYPDVVKKEELKKILYKQGEFTVNKYHKHHSEQNPEKLGMIKESTLDRAMYDKILSFAKKRNLRVEPESELIYLVDSKNVKVSLITDMSFCAATPDLFEAIGKEIYGLKI